MTQTNKLGYLNGNGRKCQRPAKNSQMSGSEQALEVGIVDVEKATEVISGRRRLFSATRLTDARKPAQSLQPLRAICHTGWSYGRDECLSHIRLCGHSSTFRDDL